MIELPVVAEDAAHAELGASTAARWLACAGSVRLSRGMPSVESYAADEGSAAHWLAEVCLREGKDPEFFVGIAFKGKRETVEITEDMAEHVTLYVQHVRNRLSASPRGIWGTEQKFSLAKLEPPEPMFGTTDFWLYDPDTHTLYVDDLKYGQGVMVEIAGNVQTRYYGLGALLHLDPGTVVHDIVMTIIQPRKDHEHGFIRSETITLLDLMRFRDELIAGAHATQDPNAPLIAGPHCRFCPAKPMCPELAAQSMAIAQAEFSVAPAVMPPAPEMIPMEQLSEFLTKLPILDDWSKAVKLHAEHLMKQGIDVPGFKLVERRAERRWINPHIVADILHGHGLTAGSFESPVLKSVAQIEKLFRGKKKFEQALGQHVIKKASGTKLVPDSDNRPAVVLTRGEEFPLLPAGEPVENEGEKKEKE